MSTPRLIPERYQKITENKSVFCVRVNFSLVCSDKNVIKTEVDTRYRKIQFCDKTSVLISLKLRQRAVAQRMRDSQVRFPVPMYGLHEKFCMKFYE